MRRQIVGFFAAILGAVLLSAGVAWADSATLNWTANVELDLAGYKLYRATGTCPTGIIPGPAIITLGKVITYVDATVPDFDGNLCYELTAYDTAGNESPHSLRASKAVNGLPPVAPLGLGIAGVTP